MNPPLFRETFLKKHLEIHPYRNNSTYVKSLIETLEKGESQKPFYPDKRLFEAAEFHAIDMGETGMTGHTSSDGSSFGTRLRQFGTWSGIAENCSYAVSEPLAIILQLLIDDGVPSLGHRRTMLNSSYSYVGVAVREHKLYGHNAVLDYGF